MLLSGSLTENGQSFTTSNLIISFLLSLPTGTLRIDIRGERVERIPEEDGFRLRRLELAKDAGDAVSDVAAILFLFLLHVPPRI